MQYEPLDEIFASLSLSLARVQIVGHDKDKAKIKRDNELIHTASTIRPTTIRSADWIRSDHLAQSDPLNWQLCGGSGGLFELPIDSACAKFKIVDHVNHL